MTTYIAFSGGKDSTAMAYRMAELGETFSLLFTPTGNELPDLKAHIDRVVADLGVEIVMPPGPSLMELIEQFNALPNWRQRWCTRMVKIVPCIAHLKKNPGSILCVGLRADEESRVGLYGEFAEYRYPLREWGWGIKDVFAYLRERGVTIPVRTDCALCYGQRIGEWYALWRDYPAEFAKGEELEKKTGRTFRSAQRDTWPAALSELRARFEAGDAPRGVGPVDQNQLPCRVCRS